MTLLTKPEAEKLVKQASSVARIPATMKDVQTRSDCSCVVGFGVTVFVRGRSVRQHHTRTDTGAGLVGSDSFHHWSFRRSPNIVVQYL